MLSLSWSEWLATYQDVSRLTVTYNFFIPIYAICSGRRDVGQINVNILQDLQSYIANLALAISFS